MSKIDYGLISSDIYNVLSILPAIENMVVNSRSLSTPKEYIFLLDEIRQLIDKEIELQGRVDD